jgi:hypothetical protein
VTRGLYRIVVEIVHPAFFVPLNIEHHPQFADAVFVAEAYHVVHLQPTE